VLKKASDAGLFRAQKMVHASISVAPPSKKASRNDAIVVQLLGGVASWLS